MPTRLAPDTIIAQVNLSGALSAIQDDPDSPDANWWTSTGGAAEARVGFPTPTGNLATGAGLQEFRFRTRKNASAGSTLTFTAALREAGGSGDLAISSTFTETSTTGTVRALTWDASLLADISGIEVEIRILQTGGHTGPSSNRRYLEVGAVEWNAELDAAVSGAGVVTLGAISAAGSGQHVIAGDGAATLTGPAAAAAGVVGFEGSAAALLGALTTAGVGEFGSIEPIEGTAAASLTALTAAGSGVQGFVASGAASLSALTASGAGALVVQGTGGATLAPIFANANAGHGPTGAGQGTFPAVRAAAGGTFGAVTSRARRRQVLMIGA